MKGLALRSLEMAQELGTIPREMIEKDRAGVLSTIESIQRKFFEMRR